MESLTVDMTYGEALFEAARDTEKLTEISEELDGLRKLFKEEPMLFEFIKAPTVSAEQKKASVKEIFKERISTEMLNFLFILIDKRRGFNFDGIVKWYDHLLDQSEGITHGDVFSVVELDDDEISRLEEGTSKLLQKQVRLTNKIDETLIGGVKLHIDGKLIDGSIKKRLEELKEVII